MIPHLRGRLLIHRENHYLGLRDVWYKIAEMRIPRWQERFGALNGRIYAIGGYRDTNRYDGICPQKPLTSVEVYIARTDTWTAVAPLPVALLRVGVVTGDDRLFVCGGMSGKDVSNYAFSYDPAADAWTRLREMPTARTFCTGCVAADGLIFGVGGEYDAERCVRVDAYDPVNDQWVRKGDLIRSCDFLGCAWLDGKVYVLGGDEEEGDGDGSIEVYDEDTDSWALHECRLPQAKRCLSSVVMKLKRG
ncbi:kelch-like protein 1 [Paramacrobiotus metropolitanus]|uniref:kelch-like protein 1 n=1 Tax=Paramacrobiotus metropolitanus TaxID=2943436 RepID=UPI0024463FF9|nr:kelch-like protein 1 [Paramacrobiotus metropolitanus]